MPLTGWGFFNFGDRIPKGSLFWNRFDDINGNMVFDLIEDQDLDNDAVCNALDTQDNSGDPNPSTEIEAEGTAAETFAEGTFIEIDWGSPGKQHMTVGTATD